jgi:flagellar biosynthesis protein
MHKTQREAVALEYGLNKAPVVVAKGTEEIAEKILEEAQKHGVYVARDPQLLAMLARLDVDQEIPPNLYTAVAVILSWAYWLKGMEPGDEQNEGSDTKGQDLKGRV